MKISKTKLIGEFIKTIKIPGVNPPKQIIIAPVGVVGSGKTTTMNILKKMLPLAYINHDAIRCFLKKKKIRGIIQMWEIAKPTLEYCLKLNKSVIMDGDFVDWRTRRKPIESLAKNFNAKIHYIHITAPEDFIIKKFINKKWNKYGLFKDSVIGIKEYFRRKPLHQKKLNIKFVGAVNTSKTIKPQLLEIIKKIKLW